MNWKPTENIDAEVRRWMKTKGWEVNRPPEYDSHRQVYSWLREGRGRSAALRIERKVLETYPAFAVLFHLDRLKVARAIHAYPEARFVVAQRGTDVLLMEEPAEPGAS